MADSLGLTPPQVAMLEGYFRHVSRVPDEELDNLTAAVNRMDKTNADVPKELVREWFERKMKERDDFDLDLDEEEPEEKDKGKKKKNQCNGVTVMKEAEEYKMKRMSDQGQYSLENWKEDGKGKEKKTSSRPASSFSSPVPVSGLTVTKNPLLSPSSSSSSSSSCLSTTSGGLTVTKNPLLGPSSSSSFLSNPGSSKNHLLSPSASSTLPGASEGKVEDPKYAGLSSDRADKLRARTRTISSGNLKGLLSRSNRSSAKVQSAREHTIPIRDGVDAFVSSPRTVYQWNEIDEDGDLSQFCVDFKEMRKDLFHLEVGRNDHPQGEDTTLFEEEENHPYFEQEFLGQSHFTFGGMSETHGPVVVSIKSAPQQVVREPGGHNLSRGAAFVIARTVVGDERMVISFRESFKTGSTKKAILKSFRKNAPRFDDINFQKLGGNGLEKALIDLEKHFISLNYKFGVLRWAPGQGENEMFSNTKGSPLYDEFLDFLGESILLKGWEKFRGGLDVKTNTTGTHSIFTNFGNSFEIMFHVSTLLPHDPNDAQQLERKRHIGNDVVIIIFLDTENPEDKWDPEMICSHVNQVFVLVRPCRTLTGKAYYVNIINKDGVPPYTPFLTSPPIYPPDDESRHHFLLKIINAGRAAMHAPVYRGKLRRSRRQMLENIVKSYPDG